MAWKFVLTDSRTGTPIGELTDASARKVSLPLNRVPSGSWILQTNNAFVNTCRKLDQVLVKAYRSNVLMALGPLVPSYTKSVSQTGKTLQVNWAGVGWRLGRRIIESTKSPSGVGYGPADRGIIAAIIINELNSVLHIPGTTQAQTETGIRIGTVGVSSSTSVGPWFYKNALQAISELSATLDGFDWELAPTEPTPDATGLQIAMFNCALAIGSARPDVVWEYGDGKRNVASFTETSDFSGSMNQGYSLPTSFPDNAADAVLVNADVGSITGRNALYEDMVQSDLNTADMRTRLLAENINIRKNPRTIITFQPSVDMTPGVVPQFGTDYIVGDTMQFRAVEYGVETVNAVFRCYGVDFDIDDNGNETATPLLVSQDT